MSLLVAEVYDALRALGLDDDRARLAAKAVIGAEDRATLATKADIAELESRLIKWCVGTMIAMTAIFAAISRLT